MPNLSARLSGPEIFIKRDDCTGLALGGNKTRHLDFYLGDAIAQSADTILITGAIQSNYVRLAAAAARKCGMECHIQLENRVLKDAEEYHNSGNVLLDRLLGAKIHNFSNGEDEAGADRNLEVIADSLRQQGRSPYVIHLLPGHPPLGTLGYVDAAAELLIQLVERNIEISRIFIASGSGHTHSGLLTGLRAFESQIPVTGICVRRNAVEQRQRIADRSQEICSLLGIEQILAESDVTVDDTYLAPGYGQLNEETFEALSLCAQTEGVILDPVYTGKAMAALIGHVRATASDSPLMFIHTGGTPALFGYESVLNPAELNKFRLPGIQG